MEKRGLSAVVATVLIVLITVALGGMIATFVVPYVRDNLQKSTECLAYKDYFKFEENIQGNDYNCYAPPSSGTGTVIGASVRANQGDSTNPSDLLGFNIAFTKSDGTTAVKEYRVQSPSKASNGVWMTGSSGSSVVLPASNDIITYSYWYASVAQINMAEIYPVLKSGRICDKSDTIEVRQCAAGTDVNA